MCERPKGQDEGTAEAGASHPDLDLDLLDYLQSLTAAQRLERHDQALALARALWRAGRNMDGVDAGPPETAS
jgi:hypothetical protein